MEARLSFVTLGVADLARATAFYRDVLQLPQIAMPDGAGVAFFELGHTWLSLYPRAALAADAGVADSPPAAFPGFALAHNVRSAQQVDALLAKVAARGGRIVLIGDEEAKMELATELAGAALLKPMAPDFSAIVYAIPAQLLAYHAAVFMGKDVDQPRNLAKSVTVE